MDLKGVVAGLYFNTKEKDSNGNFIQPVIVLEAEGEKKRLYLPKTQVEDANCRKGDIVEIFNVVESSGFLRIEPQNIKVQGQDRRKAPMKTQDDKQMSIWKGQALNLAYARAIDDQLFDNDDKDEVKAEILKNAQDALEIIMEWQNA